MAEAVFPVSLPERSAWFAKLKTYYGRVRDGGSDGVIVIALKIPPLRLREVGRITGSILPGVCLGLALSFVARSISGGGSRSRVESVDRSPCKVHWRVAMGCAECPGALEV